MSVLNLKKIFHNDSSHRQIFNRHIDLCFLALLFVVVIILFRVGMLQSTDVYQNQCENLKRNHLREVWDIPVRGQIYDRNGTPLATSVKVQTVAIDPFAVRMLSEKRRTQVFKKLENILGISVSDLQELSKRKSTLIPIKKGISHESSAIILKEAKKGFMPGIELVHEQIRLYPWNIYTKVILGCVRGGKDLLDNYIFDNYLKENTHLSIKEIRKIFPWYRYSEISGATPQRGIGGVEEIFNGWLSGAEERCICHLDLNVKVRREFSEIIEKGREPCSIILTLDIDLQRFIADLIRRKVMEKQALLGMAVVMDAFDGEILAGYSVSQENSKLVDDDWHLFTASFEPGSLLKPLIMCCAFEDNAITQNDRFDCNSPLKIAGQSYSDEHRYEAYLSPREIIAFSSGCGMAQVVNKIMLREKGNFPAHFYRFLREWGIGENIRLQHTAISKSNLPPVSKWSQITPFQMAIGYELQVSPFHLLSLYAAFVNGGKRVTPLLVKKIMDKKGMTKKEFNQENHLRKCSVMNEDAPIYDYLKAVVSMPNGTGKRAAIKGLEIAGKTGTARRLVNKKYSRKSHNSSFIGILPCKDNFLVIGVFFQDIKKGSDYGGLACAPVFREIGEHIMEANE